jgi:dihydroorotate dehydrogenase subfamily 2
MLVRPLLFRLPPEQAQRVAEAALAVEPAWRALGALAQVNDPVLSRTVAGLRLRCPIGLAAGFDKQCRYLGSLGHLGFGYLVGGTVTPDPRPGNPRPRLLRQTATQSLINSLGFPSDGLQVVAARLRRLQDRPVPVLVSIAALDMEGFELSYGIMEPLVDAVELNISSPNTQGLRRFQEPGQLRELLERINSHRRKPLFVKLPPFLDDQSREQVMALLRECLAAGVAGVTAINSIPVVELRLASGRGGITGRAIYPEMLRVVRDLRQEAGGQLVINACGGIASGEDAWRALEAGADTVQLFTAMVYRGPWVAHSIALDLAKRMRANLAAGASASSPPSAV